MSPELREFVLALPLDVRQELAKCDGPAWSMASSEKYGTGLAACADTERAIVTDAHYWGRTAWLPVSPIAIALHAAKLAKRFDSHWVELRVYPCFRFEHYGCYLGSNPSPRHQPDIGVDGQSVKDDDSDCDPTGHRAAIALLQKVMAEVAP